MVSALQDDSSEVRRRALSALKAVAKVHALLFMPSILNHVPFEFLEFH